MTSPALPPDLRARVLEAARREASPTGDEVRRRARLAWLGAAAVTCAVFVGLGGLRVRREADVVAATAAGAAAVAILATWLAVGRGRSMLGRSRAALVAAAAAVPVAFLAWSAAATLLAPGGLRLSAGAPWAAHAVCFALVAAYAAAPFFVALRLRRGSDPVHPRALGASLGAAAGAWGGLLIDVHCPDDTVLHLAIGHALPIVALAIVGMSVGARALGVRGRGE
jgi:hypothetical protein